MRSGSQFSRRACALPVGRPWFWPEGGYSGSGVRGAAVQVVYRANNLIEAHLAKHALEGMDIPVFI
ncbi:MAG: hypothetical protein ACREO0_14070, partial [Pseudoxanthomonas sp.]